MESEIMETRRKGRSSRGLYVFILLHILIHAEYLF